MSGSSAIATPPAARTGKPVCKHCGAPSPSGDFCCAGCAYVYRLVHDEGLDAYYKIKDAVTAPADPSLLQPRDYGWLAAAMTQAEAAVGPGKVPALTLEIQGLSCAGCVWLIEKVFSRQPGAGRLEVNAQTGQMRMSWEPGAFDGVAFAKTLQSFNYLVGPAGQGQPTKSESRRLGGRIGLCTAFSMNVMLFALPAYFGMESTFAYAHLFSTLAMAFATLSLLAGGGYFLGRAVRALREGSMHIDLPIALGIVGSYAGSLYGWIVGDDSYVYFDFVATFILLMLVGRWAQVSAVERNQRRLLSRTPSQPPVHLLLGDGTRRELPCTELTTDMRFAVASGHALPVESRLETAEASMSLAWINGEAEPKVFRAGQRIPAGAQNLGRAEIVLSAVQPWGDSMLGELLRPVTRDDHSNRLIERVVQAYLIGVLVVAFLAGLGWWWLAGSGLKAGAVVTAILVVSCPCALGLAFPLADEMATVALRRRGVFVRAGDLWVRLSKVRTLVFDKTGTLTLETPVLVNPEVIETLDTPARTALLALVHDNPHPVSRSIHEQLLLCANVSQPLAGAVEESVGYGVSVGLWTLGRAGWRDQGARDPRERAGDVVFAQAGKVLARFHFEDRARSDARAELALLAERGYGVAILSGDRQDKVQRLAADLGIASDRAVGECSPQSKAAWLAQNGADTVLFLGDGANDSLAFDQALCRGTPVIHRGVLEQKADFFYLGQGIGGLRSLFDVNLARSRTQRWLLWFMVTYNVAAVGLSVAGHMNPLLAAILMPGGSLITLLIVGWGMRGVWGTGRVGGR